MPYRHSTQATIRHVLQLTLERYTLHASRPIHAKRVVVVDEEEVDYFDGHAAALAKPRLGQSHTSVAANTRIPTFHRRHDESEVGKSGQEEEAPEAGPSRLRARDVSSRRSSLIPDSDFLLTTRFLAIQSTSSDDPKESPHALRNYLDALYSTPLSSRSTDSVLSILRQLKKIVYLVKPSRDTEFHERAHRIRSTRKAYEAMFECLQRLKGEGVDFDRVVKARDFDPLFGVLSRHTPPAPSRSTPNAAPSVESSTTATSIPLEKDSITVLSMYRRLVDLDITPSPRSLAYIFQAQTHCLVPSQTRAKSHRARSGIHHRHLSAQAAKVWSDRAGLLKQVKHAPQSAADNTSVLEAQVLRTLDEADILSHGAMGASEENQWGDDAWESFRQVVDGWIEIRDTLVQSKLAILLPLLGRIKAHHGSAGAKVTIVRADSAREIHAVFFLLRNSLLPKDLQSRSSRPGPDDDAGRQLDVSPLVDPVDLLRLLIGYARTPGSPGPTDTSRDRLFDIRMKAVSRAVLHIRNSAYLAQDDRRLSRLIEVVASSATPLRLPGRVHAALVTATVTSHRFFDLLLQLARLPSPHTPAPINRSSRRLLHLRVTRSASIPRPTADCLPSVLAPHFKHILDWKGWRGLLVAVMERWGVGVKPETWQAYIRAKDARDGREMRRVLKVIQKEREEQYWTVPESGVRMSLPIKDPLLSREPIRLLPDSKKRHLNHLHAHGQ